MGRRYARVRAERQPPPHFVDQSSDRYERASVALTSNLDFAHWTEVFGHERMTAALLDRLVHRSTILLLEGESYRFRQSLRRQEEGGGRPAQGSHEPEKGGADAI